MPLGKGTRALSAAHDGCVSRWRERAVYALAVQAQRIADENGCDVKLKIEARDPLGRRVTLQFRAHAEPIRGAAEPKSLDAGPLEGLESVDARDSI